MIELSAELADAARGKAMFAGHFRSRIAASAKSLAICRVRRVNWASQALKIDSRCSAATINSTAPDDDTSRWVASLGELMREKLAAVDLIEKPKRAASGPFLADYIAKRKVLVESGKLSQATLLIGRVTHDCLIDFFAPRRDYATYPKVASKISATGYCRPAAGPSSGAVRKRSCDRERRWRKQQHGNDVASPASFSATQCGTDFVSRNPFE